MALTTVAKIRYRLNLETWEGTDAAMTQAMTDAEAMIKNYLGSIPGATDPDYTLAASVCTDLASFYTALITPEVFYELDAKIRKTKIDTIKEVADINLKQLLTKPNAVLLARTTTG